MKRIVFLAAVFFLIQSSADAQRLRTAHLSEGSNLQREEGAVYIEDLLDEPIKVKIAASADAYSTLAGERYLGTLKPLQVGELLAVSERAYRIRAKAQQGQIAGWINKRSVEGFTPQMEESVVLAAERKRLIDELIRCRKIALGMTQHEVQCSLGRPDKQSTATSAEGRDTVLEYIETKRVPQYSTVRDPRTGELISTTIYVEVEVGRVTAELTNGLVSRIEESEGIDLAHPQIAFVPAPYF